MSDPFVGQITLFPYNFAPNGWAFCAGQLLPIAQNTALFSLLGVQFGGNGTTNFALPDLRGRVPIGQGQGPGPLGLRHGQSAGPGIRHADDGGAPCSFARVSGFRSCGDDQRAKRGAQQREQRSVLVDWQQLARA